MARLVIIHGPVDGSLRHSESNYSFFNQPSYRGFSLLFVKAVLSLTMLGSLYSANSILERLPDAFTGSAYPVAVMMALVSVLVDLDME